MAFSENIVNVDIVLSTTAVTVAGFGTPIFASEHRWFKERAKSYTSLTSVAEDIPAGTNEFVAAQAFFNSTPSPKPIMIGRRLTLTVDLYPDAAEDAGVSYNIAGLDGAGVVFTMSYISDAAKTPAEVATALVASLAGGNTDITVSDETGYVRILGATDVWTITDLSSTLEAVYPSTSETAVEMMTAIRDVEDDFYFVTSNDHSDSFVNDPDDGMAGYIEGTEKLYFVSSAATATLASFSSGIAPVGDVVGKLTEDIRERSVSFFHQDADTIFPECNYIGKFAPFNPGEEVWTQKEIGISVSQDPASGNRLSSTQLGYLADRNCNFIQAQGGVAVVRQGYTATGEDIATMRFRDFLTARITEAYQLKAINTVGKIPYTDSGINGQRSVLESVLNRYVSTPDQPRGLQETPAYTTSFPRRIDVDPSKVLLGELDGSFVAYLSGAIRVTSIQGNLTIEGLA